jgi:hypothetical protein
MNDAELRALWRKHGGSFHGPRVETATMPEHQWLTFMREILATAAPAPSAGETVLRYCDYCKSWNSKPCGEGCVWTPDMPTTLPPSPGLLEDMVLVPRGLLDSSAGMLKELGERLKLDDMKVIASNLAAAPTTGETP